MVEELYDVQRDPDCLHNLIDDPSCQEELDRLREKLEAWMAKTGDHMLDVFRQRDNAEAREAYVQAAEKQAEQRKQKRRRPAARKRKGLISLMLPEQVAAGRPITVSVRHTLPAGVGELPIQVTLKEGVAGKRLERKSVRAAGKGVVEVTFELPAKIADNQIQIAAFVGKTYQQSLQHLQSKPLKVQP